MNRWLTTAQAAEKLGFKTRRAFIAYVNREGVPHVTLGRSWRFSDAKLEQFMEMLSKRPQPTRRRR